MSESLAKPESRDPLADALLGQFLSDPIRRRILEQSRRPILEHVQDWEQWMAGRDTAKHVTDTGRRVRLLIELTGASRFADLTPALIQSALARLAEHPRRYKTRTRTYSCSGRGRRRAPGASRRRFPAGDVATSPAFKHWVSEVRASEVGAGASMDCCPHPAPFNILDGNTSGCVAGAAPAMTAAGARTTAGRTARGASTRNHYLGSLRAFCHFVVSDYRAEYDPSFSARPVNERLDVRRPRRAMSKDELLRLITAATMGPPICGIPGSERALGYLLAATCGLRSREIQTLRLICIHADGVGDHHLVIEACYSKHRRRDVVPLRDDVAFILARWLRDYAAAKEAAGEPLFRRPKSNAMRSLRADLAAAGLPYLDSRGYADFHALRHTFISRLFDEARASQPEVQALARHLDSRMTARYAHAREDSMRSRIEQVESLDLVNVRWSPNVG